MARDLLEPHVGKRITIRGWASAPGTWYDPRSHRIITTRCIQRPEHYGKILCDHVWLYHSNKLNDADVTSGAYIEFDAEVKAYRKHRRVANSSGLMVETDYHLDLPTSVEVIEEAPLPEQAKQAPSSYTYRLTKSELAQLATLKTVDPPIQGPMLQSDTKQETQSTVKSVRTDGTRLMSQVERLVEEFGTEKVIKATEFLRDLG
jgi:hypothetical protein